MKKLILLLTASLISFHLFAQKEGTGLGVIIGEPTGLSAKIWTGEITAVDAALAWSLTGRGYFHLHADMLMHKVVKDLNQGELAAYFGIGAKLDLASDLGLGIRIPLGIAYLIEAAPIDLFAEFVPILNLIPATTFSIEGGIGVRYFF